MAATLAACTWCFRTDTFCKCHRSADRSGRYPEDAELRAAGFTIEFRPRKGAALWRSYNGQRLSFDDALKLVRTQQKG